MMLAWIVVATIWMVAVTVWIVLTQIRLREASNQDDAPASRQNDG